MSQCLQKKLSMTLKLDGVPRYQYSVPSTDDTSTGTKKKYRGTFVHGTAHLCELCIIIANYDPKNLYNFHSTGFFGVLPRYTFLMLFQNVWCTTIRGKKKVKRKHSVCKCPKFYAHQLENESFRLYQEFEIASKMHKLR